jgi:hypothetical protein
MSEQDAQVHAARVALCLQGLVILTGQVLDVRVGGGVVGLLDRLDDVQHVRVLLVIPVLTQRGSGMARILTTRVLRWEWQGV